MKLISLRQRRILEMLDADEELHVAALAESLDVSQETIRRDLIQLEARGSLKRVHGGAISLSSPRLRPLDERAAVKRSEKQHIAELACQFVGEGQMVFVGEGTTTLAFAAEITNRVAARYMTNMIDIAQILAGNKRNEVSLTTGVLDADHGILTGYGPIRTIQGRHFDVAITGTSGIHPKIGFLEYDESYADLFRVLSEQSKRYIVLADHSKFGKGPPIRTFPLETVDVVVTDRRPSKTYQNALGSAGVDIVFASDPARDPTDPCTKREPAQ